MVPQPDSNGTLNIPAIASPVTLLIAILLQLSSKTGIPFGYYRPDRENIPGRGSWNRIGREAVQKEGALPEQDKRARFERLVLPHLDAAYSLATWLVRDDAQAEEAVQESYLRAFRFFAGLRGDDARPWLLGIVRNTCYSLLQRARKDGSAMSFDEEGCGEEAIAAGAVVSFPVNPEAAAIREADCERVRECLRALPAEYREAVVLREIHGFSYREIAAVCAVPIGTVMSRIARGRRLLQQSLVAHAPREDTGT